MSVPLNLPPTCRSTSCLSLDTSTGTFPAAVFTATASDWSSPSGDALVYEFGVMQGSDGLTAQALGSSNTYVFKGLSLGNHTVYTCAVSAGSSGWGWT